MSNPNEKKGILAEVTNLKNIVLTLLAIATGITTYLNLARSNDLQAQLNTADIELKKLEKDINQKQFSNEQFLLLNREVRESLSKDNNCDQRLLLVMLVDEMLGDKTDIRDNTRKIINNGDPSCSVTAYIKKEVENEKDYEEKQAKLVEHTTKYRVDIFYLEDNSEAKTKAGDVERLIKQKYPKYQVQSRLLPRSVNARSGYRIEENQIRFDSDEKEVSKNLQELIIEGSILLEQPNLVQIGNKTTNYVSVFIRNT